MQKALAKGRFVNIDRSRITQTVEHKFEYILS